MTKEELFAQAKQEIFGAPPKCKMELVGYNLAINSLAYLIPEAEAALQKIGIPAKNLQTYLGNSFKLLTENAYESFPDDSIRIFRKCLRKFHDRYERLVKAA